MVSFAFIIWLSACFISKYTHDQHYLREFQGPNRLDIFQPSLHSRNFLNISIPKALTNRTGSVNQCLTRANRAKCITTCNYLSLLLIALACDVELNPGPEYPCGMCNQKVSWSHQGVCCDSCDAWFHASCQNINLTTQIVHEYAFSVECLTSAVAFSPLIT